MITNTKNIANCSVIFTLFRANQNAKPKVTVTTESFGTPMTAALLQARHPLFRVFVRSKQALVFQPSEHAGDDTDDELNIDGEFIELILLWQKPIAKSQKVAKAQEQAPETQNGKGWMNRCFQAGEKASVMSGHEQRFQTNLRRKNVEYMSIDAPKTHRSW